MKGRGIRILAIAGLLMAAIFAAIPTVMAATGDLISTSPTLVMFRLDRNSGYGHWLDASEANQVVQNKIKPALRNARPNDYRSYFDSKPAWYTRQYLWEDLITSDLMYHYNYLRWDNDIGYNDWYISQSYWD